MCVSPPYTLVIKYAIVPSSLKPPIMLFHPQKAPKMGCDSGPPRYIYTYTYMCVCVLLVLLLLFLYI